MESLTLELVVTHYYAESKNVIVVELQDEQQRSLPAFTAGSHLEVFLHNGLIRHYSLLNAPDETHRYVIAIGLAPESRGGSAYMHQCLKVGSKLKVAPPRNNFVLQEATAYCFIAGGIGITPILSMIHDCIQHAKPWRLIYAVKNKQRAAFYEYLKDLAPDQVTFHFDEEHQGILNIEQLVQNLSEQEDLYCCGPNLMMQALKDATQHLPQKRTHFEWFSAPTLDQKIEIEELDTFTIRLTQSNTAITVPSDQSILEALEEAGYEIPFSCRAGICRTCEIKVCSGIPDHKDMILSEDEKLSNQMMMVCVSRAKSPVLELEL